MVLLPAWLQTWILHTNIHTHSTHSIFNSLLPENGLTPLSKAKPSKTVHSENDSNTLPDHDRENHISPFDRLIRSHLTHSSATLQTSSTIPNHDEQHVHQIDAEKI